ncbi:hypothetical protein [Aeromonas veronii]|uniref:restriction endonuclease subunit S n=1 Tax=Aeromonas veronii TaxID=654 RepID=UPI003D1C2BF9
MTERSLFNRIKSDQLADRIDPEYYTKDLLANEALLERFHESRLCDLVDKSKPNNIADLTSNGSFEFLRGIEFNEVDGIPFIRTQNLMDGYVDDGEVIYVNQECRSMVAKSLCETGDLIVCRKGKVGAASALPEKMNGAAISENVTRFSLLADDDGDFIAAFLNSNQGRKRFLREATGVIQKWINNEKLREIRVIRLDAHAEKYIGDKVRQAERLRAWAKAERVKIDLYFDSILNGIYQERPERCFSRISNEILVPRLNAEFYAPEFVSVEIGLRQKFGKLTTIGKLAPTIRSKEKPRGDCRYFEIGDLSTSKGTFEQGSYYKKGEAPNNAQRKFDIGDVAVSTRRPNRGAIAVVEDGDVNNFYSVFLARLKPKNISFGYWLKEFLRHEIGKLLLQQRCTWTTYPVISEDDLETIPVPVIEGDWEYISNLSKQSALLEYHSKQLSNSAKLLVEDLIEGQITEAQLIAAEQALQAGNDALDRKILGRLKTDGIDGDGAALFSDLDELYRLLALAEVE